MESINHYDYTIELLGPFSLGTIFFIFFGFIGLVYTRNILRNKLVISYLIIVIGSIVASLTLEDSFSSLSRSMGIFILFLSSIGWSYFWRNKYFLKYFNFFIIINFSYWSIYIINLVYGSDTILSYSLLFSEVDGVINHHKVALPISISSIYLLHRYFINNKKVLKTGYVFILFTFLLLILSESRSNLLFYLIFIIITFISLYKSSFRSSFLIFLTFFTFAFLYEYLFSSYERIYQRFNITDFDYQVITTQVRVEVLKAFPNEFFNHLLGKGPLSVQIEVLYNSYNLHNNYLTLIFSGGIIALYGVIKYLTRMYFLFRNYVKQIFKYESKFRPIFFLIILYSITLFSIDLGDLFYYIILSGVFYFDYENNQLRINNT